MKTSPAVVTVFLTALLALVAAPAQALVAAPGPAPLPLRSAPGSQALRAQALTLGDRLAAERRSDAVRASARSHGRAVARLTRSVIALDRALLACSTASGATVQQVLERNALALALDRQALRLVRRALGRDSALAGELETLGRRLAVLDRAVKDKFKPHKPTPSPTPSVTAMATPQPSPTPTPEPTPTAAAPSPSPSPTVAPSPTPEPTPSGTPLPTPSPSPSAAGEVVSVTAWGADGSDQGDDTAAVAAAVAATAGTGTTLAFPAGTYLVTRLVLPAGLHVAGAGEGATWLRGSFEVGADSTFRDLTIGCDGRALRFVNGAHDVLFERVTFVGGGGMASGEDQGVIRFSGQRHAHFITFRDCTVGANSADGNGVSIVSYAWGGGTYDHLLFERVHFLSSPRMTVEVIQRNDGVHPASDGYDHIDFVDCVFEPAGSEALSFDTSHGTAGFSTVRGCLFKGSGTNPAYAWGQTVEFNRVVGMAFTGNMLVRARGAMLNWSGQPGVDCQTVVSGNTFDTTVAWAAVTPSALTQVIYMNGVHGAVVRDNVIRTDAGAGPMYLSGVCAAMFTGNRWVDLRPATTSPVAYVTDGSCDNTFEGEQFTSAYRYGTLVFKNGADRNTVRRCTFVNGGTRPVSVEAGLTVVLEDNVVQ